VSSAIGCTKFLQIGTMEEAFTHRYLELDFEKNNEYNRHVIYSVAKIIAKYTLKVRAAQIGMDFVYVLHSHVMGPGDDKDSFLQVTLEKLIHGGELVFSSGHQYFDVISPIDCANGYLLIGEKGAPGAEYWVGSGNPRPLREYVEIMYGLYPSSEKMRFGEMPYNDIVLAPEDFSIENLVRDTGYAPSFSYEQIVENLYQSMITTGAAR
jgi:nucleoside-diphosphate-sugar epimerase